MDTKDNNLVKMAVITSAFGIKGGVKVLSFSADASSLAHYEYFIDQNGKQYKLSIISVQKNIIRAMIDGVSDRNTAEQLRGTELYVERSSFADTVEGEYYYYDLVGMEVKDSTGCILGCVKSVDEHGAGDFLDILLYEGNITISVPFANEYIDDVNVAENFLVLKRYNEVIVNP